MVRNMLGLVRGHKWVAHRPQMCFLGPTEVCVCTCVCVFRFCFLSAFECRHSRFFLGSPAPYYPYTWPDVYLCLVGLATGSIWTNSSTSWEERKIENRVRDDYTAHCDIRNYLIRNYLTTIYNRWFFSFSDIWKITSKMRKNNTLLRSMPPIAFII